MRGTSSGIRFVPEGVRERQREDARELALLATIIQAAHGGLTDESLSLAIEIRDMARKHAGLPT